jgi:hypothetical protein
VLGFIEHLTIQWLVVGRPEKISGYRERIFEMVMRAIEKDKNEDWVTLEVRIDRRTAEELGRSDSK